MALAHGQNRLKALRVNAQFVIERGAMKPARK